jgi:hypothetical protein
MKLDVVQDTFQRAFSRRTATEHMIGDGVAGYPGTGA